jgi:hypothetical protein
MSFTNKELFLLIIFVLIFGIENIALGKVYKDGLAKLIDLFCSLFIMVIEAFVIGLDLRNKIKPGDKGDFRQL